ncbi:MAG: hypothetical protein WB444_09410, partial [Gallionella sp.]
VAAHLAQPYHRQSHNRSFKIISYRAASAVKIKFAAMILPKERYAFIKTPSAMPLAHLRNKR